MPAATWIAHVKSVYSKGNMTYKQAMQRAAKTWKKKRKSKAKEPEEDEEPEEEEKEAPKRKRKRARPGPGKFEKNIN